MKTASRYLVQLILAGGAGWWMNENYGSLVRFPLAWVSGNALDSAYRADLLLRIGIAAVFPVATLAIAFFWRNRKNPAPTVIFDLLVLAFTTTALVLTIQWINKLWYEDLGGPPLFF